MMLNRRYMSIVGCNYSGQYNDAFKKCRREAVSHTKCSDISFITGTRRHWLIIYDDRCLRIRRWKWKRAWSYGYQRRWRFSPIILRGNERRIEEPSAPLLPYRLYKILLPDYGRRRWAQMGRLSASFSLSRVHGGAFVPGYPQYPSCCLDCDWARRYIIRIIEAYYWLIYVYTDSSWKIYGDISSGYIFIMRVSGMEELRVNTITMARHARHNAD